MDRELRHLEGLAWRRRFRRRTMRGLRGGLGGAATLAALVKLKLAGPLAVKLGLAVLVGAGLAWPTLALGVLALAGLVLAVFSLFDGGGAHGLDADCPGACGRRERRAARLKALIVQRRNWLAAPSGPAPSIRWDAAGRQLVRSQARERGRSAAPAR